MTRYRETMLDQVYRVLIDYWSKYDMSPSVEEMAQLLHYTSRTNVTGYLEELEKRGMVSIRHGKQRCIQVVGAKWTPPEW